MPNLAFVFGGALAAAVVIDYGVKSTKSAFANAGSGVSGGAASSPTVGGTGAGPSKGTGSLNTAQLAFAKRLQKDTGLNPAVISSWLLNEEPASSSQAPNGANNWLNIGAFDGGNWQGGSNPVWSSPESGADATASFILGHPVNGVNAPMYGASSIRAIIDTVGKSAQAQAQAIEASGWATSHYHGNGIQSLLSLFGA